MPTDQSAMNNGHGPGHAPAAGAPILRTSWVSRSLPAFVRGYAAGMTGSDEAADSLDTLGGLLTEQGGGDKAPAIQINMMELSALYALTIKDQPKAIEWMQKATALEEKMSPPSGPPSLIKPTHELYGEILLRAGKPAEAAEQFKVALQRQPNRARSLLGAARAAAQSGNQSAAQSAYAALIDQCKQADSGLSELREARDYLKQAKR